MSTPFPSLSTTDHFSSLPKTSCSGSQRRSSYARVLGLESLEERIVLAAPIAIDGNFDDWDLVDYVGGFDPAGDTHDTEHDQQNETPDPVEHPDVDLLEYRVTHDEENLYFYFRATGEIGRTQDSATGGRAGRYYVIVTIDVDNNPDTGYWLHEGGYYPTTDGYDMNAELEFYDGEYNTGHYLNHGALNDTQLTQAFLDQTQGAYVEGNDGPYSPGYVNVLPGFYDYYTQWVYQENNPGTSDDDQIVLVRDRGPVVPGIMSYAVSADGHELEMMAPLKGFLTYQSGSPIIGPNSSLHLSFSLEASGELANGTPENPNGIWASDTADHIRNYSLSSNLLPSVTLENTVTSLPKDTDTSSRIKVADILVSDDGQGTNNLSLTGDDKAMFEIDGTELYLKAGVSLDDQANPVLDVRVKVDDPSAGSAPDDYADLSINIENVNLAPTANAGGPYTVSAGGSIALDGSDSSDPDQSSSSLSYAWDLDGDGQYDDATGQTPTFQADTLTGGQTKTVGLRVTDNEGVSHFDTASVEIIAAPTEFSGARISNRVLEIGGTAGDDFVKIIKRSGGMIEIQAAFLTGGKVRFSESDFDVTDIALYDGNDTLTLYGGDNLIDGGMGDDTIRTNGGDDTINGGGGNDLIIDRGGSNIILGASGDDVIKALGSGNDYIDTGEGNNTVKLSGGNNIVLGGSGNDTISALGNNSIDAGEGDNSIRTNGGDDTIVSGSGDDVVIDRGGNNIIATGAGADRVKLYGSGDNWVRGGLGRDTIMGGDGNDVLLGEADNDRLTGGLGRDILIGGIGGDRFYGKEGDDLLVAGSTIYDENDVALLALLTEWTSQKSYLERAANVTNGGGANGDVILDRTSTLIDDGVKDQLRGELDIDLFFATGDDWIRDLTANELQF